MSNAPPATLARHRATLVDQIERGVAFRRARGDGYAAADHQAVPVLHQRMAHEAQLAFPAFALAIQPRVPIGGAFMAGVGTLLAVEVAFLIVPRGPSPVRSTDGPYRNKEP